LKAKYQWQQPLFFWPLRVENAEVQLNTYALQYKGNYFLSPNMKLASLEKDGPIIESRISAAIW
jgi:hypothetical protein